MEAVLRAPRAGETRALLRAAALGTRRTTVVEAPMRPAGPTHTGDQYVR